MIKINFYLDRKSNRKKSTADMIFVFASYNGKRKKASTRIRIDQAHWDSKKQRAKSSKSFPAYLPINSLLNEIENQATASYYSCQLSKEEFRFKEIVQEIVKPQAVSKKVTLISYIESFIAKKVKAKVPKGTLSVFKTAYKHLKYFNDYYYPIDFDTIDLKFFKDYKEYLFIERKMKQNHASKMVSKLKQFMNEAFDEELHNNQKYKSTKFNIKREPSDAIYYNVSELIQLYNFQPSIPSLERVRDAFLIYAFTFFRFSDGMKITIDRVIENQNGKTIQLINQKTGAKVIIPLHWIVEEVLEKYQGAPPQISNQKMNEYLKDLFLEAGFTQKVQITFTRGGVRKIEEYQKWQLTTTHTGRRSAATNLRLAGVDEDIVMMLGGWKSVTEFRKYVKIDNLQNAMIVAQLPFWQKPELRKVK